MGMDPATIALITSAAGSLGGKIFAPEGQEISSFENSAPGGHSIDPRDMLQGAQGHLDQVFSLLLKNALTPPDLSDAYVQSPPNFSGGGLAMPVGVTGSWGADKPSRPASSFFDGLEAYPTKTTTTHTTDRPGPPDVEGNPRPKEPTSSPYDLPGSSGDVNAPTQSRTQDVGQSLLTAMAGTPQSGPQRVAYSPAGQLPQSQGDGSADKAKGAVSLLLHLASGQKAA